MSDVISTTTTIDAGTDVVWGVLVDLPRYGEWSTFSSAEGRAEVGQRLTMRMPGSTFHPKVTVVEHGRRLQWSGTLLSERLFLGRHSFVLTANPDGTTHLLDLEEFDGVLTSLLGRFTKKGGANGCTAYGTAGGRPSEKPRCRWSLWDASVKYPGLAPFRSKGPPTSVAPTVLAATMTSASSSRGVARSTT